MRNCMRLARRGDGGIRILRATTTCCGDLVQSDSHIYVFYDSAGRVTYLGKTEKCFWNEIRQRLKGKINRPYYSPKRVPDVQQGEVARKLSVYEVRVPAAIHNLEVLMLRAFPNDLANTNVGNFKKRLKRHGA